MEVHTATKKPHRCWLCGRRIPIGAFYFCEPGGDNREHDNCEDYRAEPLMHPLYNGDRSFGELDCTPPDRVDSFGRLIDD